MYAHILKHVKARQIVFLVFDFLGDGQVDSSPCSTGTCAKMAVLYAKGELEIGGQK